LKPVREKLQREIMNNIANFIKIRILATLLVILIFTSNSFSQNYFNFEFDYAQFGYDTTQNYVEFYYSFQRNQLTRYELNGSFNVGAKLKVKLIDKNSGNITLNKQYVVNSPVYEAVADSDGTSLVGVIGLLIGDGEYQIQITGSDNVDSLKSKTIDDLINIRRRKLDKFSLSDIQLASNIQSEDANSKSIFYKNTLEVIPNPVCVYTETSPILYYYCELYSLNQDSTVKNYELRKILLNSRQKPVYNRPKNISTEQSSIVEAGILNLKKYPTDSYTLILTLIDKESNTASSSSKKFFFINPSVIDSSDNSILASGYIGSEFALLSEEEIDDIFDKTRYIATSDEMDQYEKLDSLNAKREYMYKFWGRRDADLSTEDNEFKSEYFRRINYVNQAFSALNKVGYKSDRGRIYLVYGEPDQIDRYPNETNMKPHEIWYYNSLEGGVQFIFGDLTGFSDYELLSSTKRGEIRDDYWTRRIYSN